MENLKQIVREFVQQILTEGRADAADRYIDPAFVDHQPWPGAPGTLEGFKSGLIAFRAAFPDLRAEVEHVVEEGDTVVARVAMSGTHLGPFMGAPPTGRTFRIQGLDMVRMRSGLMIEHWGFMDTHAMGQQLGLAPPAM